MSWLLSAAKFTVILYFALYALIHILIFSNPETVRKLTFQNLVHWPWHNLSYPFSHNLTNVHNFHVEVEPGVRIGVWHYIPESQTYNHAKHLSDSMSEHLKKYIGKNNDNTPVMIYVHGNDRDRASPFRVKKCKNLNKLGYHIFAIDYRGYGDATGHPSEEGVVKDVLTLYNTIMSYNKNTTIYLYGHSLGSAIVTHTARKISESNLKLDGIVLEAPFLNISQASKDYHLSLVFLNNKWIINKVDESLQLLNIRFNTDKNIVKVKSKILILHAEDDWFIPIQHSVDLYKICKEKRPKGYPECKFVEFKKELGLGHFPSVHTPVYKLIKEFLKA